MTEPIVVPDGMIVGKKPGIVMVEYGLHRGSHSNDDK